MLLQMSLLHVFFVSIPVFNAPPLIYPWPISAAPSLITLAPDHSFPDILTTLNSYKSPWPHWLLGLSVQALESWRIISQLQPLLSPFSYLTLTDLSGFSLNVTFSGMSFLMLQPKEIQSPRICYTSQWEDVIHRQCLKAKIEKSSPGPSGPNQCRT